MCGTGNIIRKMVGVLLLFFLTSAVSAQSYPGEAVFLVRCGQEEITFLKHGSPVITVTFQQLYAPLYVARLTQHNQPIITSADVGLWALKSYQLQIHDNANPEGTKMVFAAEVCGTISAGSASQALALVWLVGPGEGLAYAHISPSGNVEGFAGVQGSGGVFVLAESVVNTPVSGQASGVYVVQPGDSLYQIAQQNNTTVEALAAANNISNPTQIYPGQQLVISGGSAPVSQPTSTSLGESSGACGGLYVVQPGDNLYRIALNHNTTLEIIAAANGIADPRQISIGQQLTIPCP